MPSPPPSIVLVADDSEVVRLAVGRRLRGEGFAVDALGTAADVRACVADATRFACALLDLDLGDADDGATLATELRLVDAALPIAFFSGETSGEVLARARRIGPVFAKPGAIDDAVAWVRANARR